MKLITDKALLAQIKKDAICVGNYSPNCGVYVLPTVIDNECFNGCDSTHVERRLCLKVAIDSGTGHFALADQPIVIDRQNYEPFLLPRGYTIAKVSSDLNEYSDSWLTSAIQTVIDSALAALLKPITDKENEFINSANEY